uniref:Uncharacterized protein n=1 Tax=Phlebotomus papatasi TaxID=29031 RepID=A0A1B0DH13_PHLPP
MFLGHWVFVCIIVVVVDAAKMTDFRPTAASITQKDQKDSSEERRAEDLKFYEVDAFGDDFTDFGAQTGPRGAFTWRANFPLYTKDSHGDHRK